MPFSPSNGNHNITPPGNHTPGPPADQSQYTRDVAARGMAAVNERRSARDNQLFGSPSTNVQSQIMPGGVGPRPQSAAFDQWLQQMQPAGMPQGGYAYGQTAKGAYAGYKNAADLPNAIEGIGNGMRNQDQAIFGQLAQNAQQGLDRTVFDYTGQDAASNIGYQAQQIVNSNRFKQDHPAQTLDSWLGSGVPSPGAGAPPLSYHGQVEPSGLPGLINSFQHAAGGAGNAVGHAAATALPVIVGGPIAGAAAGGAAAWDATSGARDAVGSGANNVWNWMRGNTDSGSSNVPVTGTLSMPPPAAAPGMMTSGQTAALQNVNDSFGFVNDQLGLAQQRADRQGSLNDWLGQNTDKYLNQQDFAANVQAIPFSNYAQRAGAQLGVDPNLVAGWFNPQSDATDFGTQRNIQAINQFGVPFSDVQSAYNQMYAGEAKGQTAMDAGQADGTGQAFDPAGNPLADANGNPYSYNSAIADATGFDGKQLADKLNMTPQMVFDVVTDPQFPSVQADIQAALDSGDPFAAQQAFDDAMQQVGAEAQHVIDGLYGADVKALGR